MSRIGTLAGLLVGLAMVGGCRDPLDRYTHPEGGGTGTRLTTNDPQQKAPTAAERPSGKVANPTMVIAGVGVRELEPYKSGSWVWRGILIPGGLEWGRVTDIARELHARFPADRFHLIDDDSQYRQFVLSMQHDSYPYPEEWTERHDIGIVNKMFTSEGPLWQLVPQTFDTPDRPTVTLGPVR